MNRIRIIVAIPFYLVAGIFGLATALLIIWANINMIMLRFGEVRDSIILLIITGIITLINGTIGYLIYGDDREAGL